MRLILGFIAALGLALVAGCNNFSAPGSGTASGGISVAIEAPAKDSPTNSLEVQVRAAVTRPGARVDRVEVVYSGPQNGTVTLVAERGSWKGTLPSTLPSGSYTLKPKAWAGTESQEGNPVSFTLDRDPPEAKFLSVPSGEVNGTVEIRVKVTDALSGINEVRLYAGNTDLGPFTPTANDEYITNLDTSTLPSGTYSLRVVAKDRAGNTKEISQKLS